MTEVVLENAEKAQQNQKAYYDRGARERLLEEGDAVLVLLPKPHHRLKLEWVGPYRVSRRVSPVDCEVETPHKQKEKKVYYVNMMKKWHQAPPSGGTALLAIEEEDPPEEAVLGLEDEDGFYPGAESGAAGEGTELEMPNLNEEQKQDILVLMREYPSVFQPVPGRTTLTAHQVHTGDAVPIRQNAYRIPYSRREVVKKELDEMLEAGVIRPSSSPWASPIVLVNKKDGGVRFCVDYRKVNAIAKFDAYPMPRVEEIFESIGSATIISNLDLAKGYWQIPLEEESKEKTAFATPFGLYEFEVMPFGLHNAPATSNARCIMF